MLTIRPAGSHDHDHEALWRMLEPVLRTAEVFALPADMDRAAALAYWFAPRHTAFIAEQNNQAVGSYYIQPNQQGGGAHIANCGYLTASHATGQGIAGFMCAHSIAYAQSAGYRAMQFNFVVSTNVAAIHLWTKYGFRTLTRLPGAFLHPAHGYVDALVLWRDL
jgi:ribosomal protein S18 acetylase RimI-like enzyme